MSFRFADTIDAAAVVPVYKRLVAHLALDELPDAALAEILDCLGNAWAFHQPTAPQVVEQPNARKGKLTRRYERPTYAIED